MHRFSCALLLGVGLLSPRAFAQQNRVVMVGVVTMQYRSNWPSAPRADVERDHLVTALDQEKPDKKLHLKIQAVPLEGTTPSDVEAEAKQKNCDYVVYTTLVEIRVFANSPTSRPGTTQDHQGGVFVKMPNNPQVREYQANMEYKLYRTGDPKAISDGPVSNREMTQPSEVVARAMAQVANRVYLEVKKATPPQP